MGGLKFDEVVSHVKQQQKKSTTGFSMNIDSDDHVKIHFICEANGITLTEFLRSCIKMVIDEYTEQSNA